jgi:hypothetical protein
MTATSYYLQGLTVIFYLLAGWFWMISALSPSKPIAPADLPTFRARWNARAAICTGIAALMQAIYFLVYLPPSIVQSGP